MSYLIVTIVYALLVNPVWVSAQETPSEPSKSPAPLETPSRAETTPKEAAIQESQKSELTIVGKEPIKMGESLKIKATGSAAASIREELAKPTGAKAVTLYLDDVRMTGLTVSASEVEAGKQLLLSIHLARNSHDDDNRKAWDTLLTKQEGYLMTPPVALAVGNKLPVAVQSAPPDPPFQFYIVSDPAIWWSLGIGLVIFLVAYYLLVKSRTALRDMKDGPYSLGKSQMAFWGLLVVLTFAGVWVLADTMERIPPQVLILLGISGATGLSAVVIGENKKVGKQSEIHNAITKLQEEQQKLEKEQLAAAANFPPVSKDRLAAIKAEIAALQVQLQSTESAGSNAITKLQEEQQKLEKEQLAAAANFPPVSQDRLAAIKAEIAALQVQLQSTESAGSSAGFWQDICDDGNGMSFHRLQVVIWTVILGVIFVWSVAQVMSMPEFSETLLILLGISNGTYLGFKIPEPS